MPFFLPPFLSVHQPPFLSFFFSFISLSLLSLCHSTFPCIHDCLFLLFISRLSSLCRYSCNPVSLSSSLSSPFSSFLSTPSIPPFLFFNHLLRSIFPLPVCLNSSISISHSLHSTFFSPSLTPSFFYSFHSSCVPFLFSHSLFFFVPRSLNLSSPLSIPPFIPLNKFMFFTLSVHLESLTVF